MTFLQYIALFTAVVVGGGMAFRFQSDNRRLLQLILSFVGAYLLGILVLHLIPDAYENSPQSIGLWVLLGFFIQLTLEQFSLGVEHGHIHDHHHTSKPMFALQVVLSLSIHAFIEGLPLSIGEQLHAAATHEHHHDHSNLFYGVAMHKAPEAFALALLLIMSGFKKQTVWLSIFAFAAMSPLGAFVTQSVHFQTDTLQKIIAVVIGSLLHISTTILFEVDNTDEHRMSWQKIGAIAIGAGLSMMTLL
jgi:zinc transporter ZupT